MRFREPTSSASPRRLPVLGVLLLAAWTQGAMGWRLDGARAAFRSLSAPLFAPFEACVAGARAVDRRFADVDALHAALEAARQRAAKAEHRAQVGEEARREAQRLRRALEARGQGAEAQRRPARFARVIGRSAFPRERRVTLDLGSTDGVRVDDPVIYGDNLLGRVLQVFEDRCRVLLIQDPASAVGVLLEGDRSPGVAMGTGDPDLRLTHLPDQTRPAEGDRVLTGSLSAYYPKGLVVGVVSRVEGAAVHLRPGLDPLRLEEAFVLVSQPQETNPPESS